jgi:hypothetical protein
MTSSLWRAAEIPLPNGVIGVDVTGTGKLTRYSVSFKAPGVSREIASLSELASLLAASHADSSRLARSDPASFAFLICVLSNRPHHIFPRESMWPELEQHFSFNRSENEPRVAEGKFQFVAYSQYMPVLKMSRLVVDLSTLEVTEVPLIDAPWPPAQEALRVLD